MNRWDAFGKELEKRRKLRAKQLKSANEQLKEAEERLSEIHSTIAEAKRRLLLENEKFRRSLPTRKKTGTTPKWEAELGLELVYAIEAITAHGTSIAEAVRTLRKSSPVWRDYGERELQSRYQKARRFWAPWIERDRELDAAAWEVELRALEVSTLSADVTETNEK